MLMDVRLVGELEGVRMSILLLLVTGTDRLLDRRVVRRGDRRGSETPLAKDDMLAFSNSSPTGEGSIAVCLLLLMEGLRGVEVACAGASCLDRRLGRIGESLLEMFFRLCL